MTDSWLFNDSVSTATSDDRMNDKLERMHWIIYIYIYMTDSWLFNDCVSTATSDDRMIMNDKLERMHWIIYR
jgi:hypothetical protein